MAKKAAPKTAEGKEGYCVKCKAKVAMIDPVESVTKNNRYITKGKCPNCGTTVCVLGSTVK